MSLPQFPHSNRTDETQASFSSTVSPASSARARDTGSSSQKTHRRHRPGSASRLSNVNETTRRGMGTSAAESAYRVTDGMSGGRPIAWENATDAPGGHGPLSHGAGVPSGGHDGRENPSARSVCRAVRGTDAWDDRVGDSGALLGR